MEEKYSKEEIKSIRTGAITLCAILVGVFITVSHNASIESKGLGGTYNLYASFGRTDGLNVGDAVRLSGVDIGRVTAAELDNNFRTRLTLEIDKHYKIPDDSSASIVSFGLIGGKYVEIDVGGSEEYLTPDSQVGYTQDAMVLEELLDRMISIGKSKSKTKEIMMNKRPVETIMGLVVLAVATLFMMFAYQVSDLQVVKGYEINARFLKVGGLNTGADVRINGIKVGTVLAQKINPEDYMVDVKMSLMPDIVLPADSTITIAGDGLMGDKFVKIEPGTSAEKLMPGSTATNTKDAKSLEDMVGEIIFMVTGNDEKN